MVVDPPTRLITNGHSSGSTLTKSKSVRKGENLGHWFARLRPTVKNKPHRGVRESNKTVCGRRTATRVLSMKR